MSVLVAANTEWQHVVWMPQEEEALIHSYGGKSRISVQHCVLVVAGQTVEQCKDTVTCLHDNYRGETFLLSKIGISPHLSNKNSLLILIHSFMTRDDYRPS